MFQSAHISVAGVSVNGGWVSDVKPDGTRFNAKFGYAVIWGKEGFFQDRSLEDAVFTIKQKDKSTLTYDKGVWQDVNGSKTAKLVVVVDDKTNSYSFKITDTAGAVLMETKTPVVVPRDGGLYVSQSADAVAQDQSPVETPTG